MALLGYVASCWQQVTSSGAPVGPVSFAKMIQISTIQFWVGTTSRQSKPLAKTFLDQRFSHPLYSLQLFRNPDSPIEVYKSFVFPSQRGSQHRSSSGKVSFRRQEISRDAGASGRSRGLKERAEKHIKHPIVGFLLKTVINIGDIMVWCFVNVLCFFVFDVLNLVLKWSKMNRVEDKP